MVGDKSSVVGNEEPIDGKPMPLEDENGEDGDDGDDSLVVVVVIAVAAVALVFF